MFTVSFVAYRLEHIMDTDNEVLDMVKQMDPLMGVFGSILIKVMDSHPTWKEMEVTKEDSPWHREDNVAVHTFMVLDEYVDLFAVTGKELTKQGLLGMLACLFHDFGKPSARVVKFKPERGHYNSFGGHELTSARFWEDFAMSNWDLFINVPDFTLRDVYAVTFLIEHHLPYDTTDRTKRETLARTVREYFGDCQLYFRALRADAWGRISDDHPDKKARTLVWFDEFQKLFDSLEPEKEFPVSESQPKLWVLIGASGSGKSTLTSKLVIDQDAQIFSLDKVRLELYGQPDLDEKDNYRQAFEKSTEDSEFAQKANNKFMAMVKQVSAKMVHPLLYTRNDIIVDNTNLSAKRRRFYIDQARRQGFRIVCVVFPIALNQLLERNESRPDKKLPVDVLRKQYFALQMPLRAEYDTILYSNGNIAIP